MEKQVLSNKIGIQVVIIIIGILLLSFGSIIAVDEIMLLEFRLSGQVVMGHIDTFPIYTFIGTCIIFVGLAAIIVGSINIANYTIIIKSINKSQVQNQTADEQDVSTIKCTDKFDSMRNKIANLQQMKADGLISDAEYDEIKSSIIKNSGDLLK